MREHAFRAAALIEVIVNERDAQRCYFAAGRSRQHERDRVLLQIRLADALHVGGLHGDRSRRERLIGIAASGPRSAAARFEPRDRPTRALRAATRRARSSRYLREHDRRVNGRARGGSQDRLQRREPGRRIELAPLMEL